MKVLFDETYASDDGKLASRNIWYGYADISIDGKYAKELRLEDGFMDELCGIIKNDLSKNDPQKPTETNWYFYGSAVNQDAIGDSVRPTIMVREKFGAFIANINMSDYNFAMNIDGVLSFKERFERRLNESI